MKYEYKTAVLENVFQSITQAKRSGDETQKAGEMFGQFMKTVTEEGWRIIAVTSLADVMIYTLERELKQ